MRELIERKDALMTLTGEIPENMTLEDYVAMVFRRLNELHPALTDIPEATSENTNMNEPLITAGYIQGWNDCREYVLSGEVRNAEESV